MGYGIAAAGGLAEAQAGLRQRLMDQLLIAKQKQDMEVQLRQQALREQEISQRTDLMKQAQQDRVDATQAKEGDVADKAAVTAFTMNPAGATLAPKLAMRGRMLGLPITDVPGVAGPPAVEGLSSLATPLQGRMLTPESTPTTYQRGQTEADINKTQAEDFAKQKFTEGLAAQTADKQAGRDAAAAMETQRQSDKQENIRLAASMRAPKDTSTADANLTNRSYQFHRTALDKLAQPLEQQQQRMSRLIETVNQGSPQADALVAPELLAVMAGGTGSGLRINEAEISRVIGGRSQWENLKATLQQWSTDPTQANSITPEQRKQIRDLIGAVQAKSDAALGVVNDAGDQLVGADVTGHRTILADARKKLQGVAAGKQEETPEQRKARLRAAAGL